MTDTESDAGPEVPLEAPEADVAEQSVPAWDDDSQRAKDTWTQAHRRTCPAPSGDDHLAWTVDDGDVSARRRA